MNKYDRAAEALKRVLMHEHEMLGPIGNQSGTLVPVALSIERVLIKSKIAKMVIPLLIVCAVVGSNKLIPIVTELAWILGGIIVLVLFLLTVLGMAREIRNRMRRKLMAQDKVDGLMTMANLPWKIDRQQLKGDRVQYRLQIPPEELDSFAGSPSITLSTAAAEKADLMILTIRADQKLLDKWQNRTLNL